MEMTTDFTDGADRKESSCFPVGCYHRRQVLCGMNGLTDQQLLRDYAEHRAEAAFAELVRRHVDLVYSAAVRMVHDGHLAEDVTQGVFVALAQNALRLRNRCALPGWLHHTTQHLAANAVRAEVRRRVREQEAVTMNELLATESNPTWDLLAPYLDAALGELSESDRDAVLLRYFENKSLREVGQALGTSDDAAQKRVSRAVERMRQFFARRGVTVGASGLVVLISANAVQAAPVGLAVSISTAATMAGTTMVSAATATATKAIAITTLKKAIVGVALATALGTGIYQAWETWSPRTRLQTLRGKPTILAHDDGRAAENLSIGVSGHVVRFEAPGPNSFLTAVQIYGKRYGTPTPPREDFHIWLCDTDARVIADFPFPYSRFQNGPEPQWVTFETKPTEVPARFLIVVGFNPTFTKGVHVSRDAQNSGESFTGLPGQTPRAFPDGDWLIRARLDQRL
jgi:RNA polymerase sigma factor (sigma-70 family)